MFKYIVLGIIQGITEFLPVSSSGHLVIMQRLLGVPGQELIISVVLHLGTTLALIIFFRQDILNLLRNIRSLSLVLIVTIITGIIGLGGRDFFTGLFKSPKLVAVSLILTGIILILTKKFGDGKRDTLNIKDAFILGLSQGIAIIPGISRSGITVSTLLFRGIDWKTSFNFSFLASIPAVLGAVILEAKDIGFVCRFNLINLFVGLIFSLLAGLAALWILRIVLRKAKLYYFGYYCIAVAVITLLFIK